jgi:LEA14-like dessication related protein
MSTKAFLVVIVLSLGVIGGYVYLDNLRDAYQNILLDIEDLAIERGVDDVEVTISLAIENPSNYELRIPSTEFSFYLNDKRLGESSSGEQIIPAKNRKSFDVSIFYDYDDVIPGLFDYVNNIVEDEQNIIRVKGNVKVTVVMYEFFIPVDYELDLNSRERMRITSPYVCQVNEDVTICVSDLGDSPVQGARVFCVNAFDSLISTNLVENLEYLGKTDQNGELEVDFDEPRAYLLFASKISE